MTAQVFFFYVFYEKGPHLNAVEFLMNYIGCTGSLMAGTGMQEVLEKVFGSVLKMLTGKKCPRCVCMHYVYLLKTYRALFCRMNVSMLQEYLTEKIRKIRTIKIWVSVPINHLFLAFQFIRATERWSLASLHLDAVKSIFPLFYAASHHNYARDGLYYLKSIENLPENV